MNQALFPNRFVELLGIEIGGGGSSDSPQWKISERPKDTQVAEQSGRGAASRPQATARTHVDQAPSFGAEDTRVDSSSVTSAAWLVSLLERQPFLPEVGRSPSPRC